MYRSTEGTVLLEESGSELVALYGFNEKRAHRVKFFIQNHGRTGRGGGGAVASPDCWANMASRPIFV